MSKPVKCVKNVKTAVRHAKTKAILVPVGKYEVVYDLWYHTEPEVRQSAALLGIAPGFLCKQLWRAANLAARTAATAKLSGTVKIQAAEILNWLLSRANPQREVVRTAMLAEDLDSPQLVQRFISLYPASSSTVRKLTDKEADEITRLERIQLALAFGKDVPVDDDVDADAEEDDADADDAEVDDEAEAEDDAENPA